MSLWEKLKQLMLKPEPEAKKIPVMAPVVMEEGPRLTKLVRAEDQIIENTTSQYGINFTERCRRWDAANPAGPEPVTLTGFGPGGTICVFAVDPSTGQRVGERIVRDAERRYGLRNGFAPQVPRL